MNNNYELEDKDLEVVHGGLGKNSSRGGNSNTAKRTNSSSSYSSTTTRMMNRSYGSAKRNMPSQAPRVSGW